MAIDTDEPTADENAAISLNGIDVTTGGDLFPPVTTARLVEMARGKTLESLESLSDLKARHERKGEAQFRVKEGIDASKLEEAGWGVIFPAVAPGSEDEKAEAAIYEALGPLLALRKVQATKRKEHYYKEYRGALGYRPGESKQKYLKRLGVGPGPADPDKVPYFLLIVGSPQVIPFQFQYQIDVQYAVGRLHFDTVEEYANYARSVVAAETGGLSLSREVAFLGVANPNDRATQLSRANLVGPLSDLAAGWTDLPGWKISRYFDTDANKATASQLFGGPRTPALLFSGSHGVGFPMGHPLQSRRQGALLLQDWPGKTEGGKPVSEDFYFSGDDIRSDSGMLGMIAFNFACYSAGTPEYDDFDSQANTRKSIAERAFVAGLHKKMLGHPKGGALATIGHVERAWGFSFMWGAGKKGAQTAQLAVFESTLKSLMRGMPVGVAVDYFNERYAEMASDLSQQLEDLKYDPASVDAFTLADLWTSNNDARGYAIMGDPAVRLPFGDAAGPAARKAREEIDVTGFGSPSPLAVAPTADLAPSDPAGSTGDTAAFGFFGGADKDKGEAKDGSEAKTGMFQSFAGKVVGTLGKAVEDALVLEVRTYVSSDPVAAANVDRATLAAGGDLRAFTRIMIDGDMDAIIPERDGAVDTKLWELHLELVKQAQLHRAEMIKTVLSSISGLIKL